MTAFFIFLHAAVCILLIAVILMQSGRGGGLTEGFAAAESIFGAKTTSFMVKTTSALAFLFLITCLSLAVLSSKKSASLMDEESIVKEETTQEVDSTTDSVVTNATVNM